MKDFFHIRSRWVGCLGLATVVVIADYLLVLTDCVIAGRVLDEYALGAMNLLIPVFSIVAFFLWLVAAGVSSVYRKQLARGNPDRAARLAFTGLVAAFLTALALVAMLALLEDAYLAFMAPGEAITAYSGEFWRWYPATMLLEAVALMLFYLIYANGGVLVCIVAYSLLTVVNLVASYWLCERYGMAGLSLGSALAYLVGIAVLSSRRLTGTGRVAFKPAFEPMPVLRSLRTSFGDAFVWLFHAFLFFAATKYVLACWAPESLAVTAIVFCVIRLITFFGGVGVALNAVKSDESFFSLASALSFMAMALFAALFLVAPEPLTALFGIEDRELVEGATFAARVTVGGLALSAAATLLPLWRRARRAGTPQAPLNYLQRYIMSRADEAPDSQMFNLAKLFRLRQGVDPVRLGAALAGAARAHAAILTVLRRDVDGEIVQRRELAPEAIECPVVKADERGLLAAPNRLVTRFGGFGEKLFNACIFDCGERAYLLSDFHHLICDGYSFPLILEDARRLYEGGKIEPDDYYGVLARREAKAALPVAVATRSYLRERLKDPKFTTLPPDDLAGEPGYGIYETPLALPPDFAAFLATHRVTRHHVFLAATVLALARLARADDVLIDWVFHGRVAKDELKTVGAFMVDLPLEIEDLAEQTPADVLSRVKQATFRGIKSVNSFRSAEDVNPDGRDRLTFIYQDEWGELMSPGPVRPDGPYGWMIDETIPLTPPAARPENPFNVEIMEHRDSTRLALEYDSGRYSEATVRRFAELFRSALADLK